MLDGQFVIFNYRDTTSKKTLYERVLESGEFMRAIQLVFSYTILSHLQHDCLQIVTLLNHRQIVIPLNIRCGQRISFRSGEMWIFLNVFLAAQVYKLKEAPLLPFTNPLQFHKRFRVPVINICVMCHNLMLLQLKTTPKQTAD